MSQPATINRKDRKNLAVLLREFLDSKITAFELDDEAHGYLDSNDATVRHVALAAWFHYDDCDDHLVCLNRSQWNYLQRLLLVLDSEHHIIETPKWRWRQSQWAAALAFVAFVNVALFWGWGWHLLLVAIPFGILSIAIARNEEFADPAAPYARILSPFASFEELKRVYVATNRFRKQRFPLELKDRRFRPLWWDRLMLGPTYGFWLIASPIVLLFQMLPTHVTTTRVMASTCSPKTVVSGS